MKFFLTLLAGLILALPCFAGDGWKVFSKPFPIYSATKYGDGVVYATGGGIRIKTPTFDRVYTSDNGLETSEYRVVVAGPNGVFAVSTYGMVAALQGSLNGWTMLNRSYLANSRKVIPDASRLVKDVLVIVFEDRIAFFDVKKEKSILTISRIGDVSFAVFPPKVISIHGDELYVSTGKKVFKRKMAWDNLWDDVRLIDPDSWTEVPTKFPVYGMAWKGDSLKMFPTEGTWQWDGDVESSSVQDSSYIKVRGQELTAAGLYENGMSIIKWIFLNSDGTELLIASEKMVLHDHGDYKDMGVYAPYELGSVYEFAVTPDGGVIAASPQGKFAYCNEESCPEILYFDETGIGNVVDAYGHRMKALSVLPDGYMLYHIWGQGFYIYSDWGQKRVKVLRPSKGYCMDEYAEGFTISVGSTPAPDSSGFLATTGSLKGYSLVYISRDGDMSCLTHVGNATMAGPLVAKVADDGENWDVFVTTRGSNGVLDVYSVSPPSRNGGRLVKNSAKKVYGLKDGFMVDLVLDPKNDVLWLASSSKLGYFELDQDSVRTPASISGFSGGDYSSLALDPHGNLWLGTAGQGVYRLSRKGNSNDTLSTLHFTSKNGMLSNSIDDIAIDPLKGILWMAHEQGITWYKRNDLRINDAFMTDSAVAEVLAFPNPFRPKIHKYISFDFLAEDATLSIYNRGGALIRFFSGSDMFGGRVDWDGTDKNGKIVVPGVYYYIVKNSKTKKKGKFIVIR